MSNIQFIVLYFTLFVATLKYCNNQWKGTGGISNKIFVAGMISVSCFFIVDVYTKELFWNVVDKLHEIHMNTSNTRTHEELNIIAACFTIVCTVFMILFTWFSGVRSCNVLDNEMLNEVIKESYDEKL